MDRIFMIFKKKMTQGLFVPCPVIIYLYMTFTMITVEQTYWNIAQISDPLVIISVNSELGTQQAIYDCLRLHIIIKLYD